MQLTAGQLQNGRRDPTLLLTNPPTRPPEEPNNIYYISRKNTKKICAYITVVSAPILSKAPHSSLPKVAEYKSHDHHLC